MTIEATFNPDLIKKMKLSNHVEIRRLPMRTVAKITGIDKASTEVNHVWSIFREVAQSQPRGLPDEIIAKIVDYTFNDTKGIVFKVEDIPRMMEQLKTDYKQAMENQKNLSLLQTSENKTRPRRP